MKKITPVFFSLLVFCGLSKAQNVVDTNPESEIYAINYQTGQEKPVTADEAVLFKDAFIDLVNGTSIPQRMLDKTPGRNVAVIKQIDPRMLNGYQLTWESVLPEKTTIVCSFYYDIDRNALFFYDSRRYNWVAVQVEGENLVNLNHCHTYSRFNINNQTVPDLSLNNNQQAVPDLSLNSSNNVDQATAEMQEGLDSLSDEEIQSSVVPPELPDYDQPPCPVDGYQWQPGYWAWNPTVADYYWVPGVWVAPLRPGLLWTPCYWEFVGGVYHFHRGYWGTAVGFYGGVHYGYGYFGEGFVGGEWRGNVYRYNTAVVHVNTTVIHNTYVNTTVINRTTVVNRASFNGKGGIAARPTQQEETAMHQQHFRPTTEQVAHQRSFISNKQQFASVNKGRPAVATMNRITANPNNFRSNISPRAQGSRSPRVKRTNKNNKPARQRSNRQPRQGKHRN